MITAREKRGERKIRSVKGVGQAREINRVIQAGLTEKSTFNQRLKGGRVSQANIWG